MKTRFTLYYIICIKKKCKLKLTFKSKLHIFLNIEKKIKFEIFIRFDC